MERSGFVPGGILRLCKGPWTALAIGGGLLIVTAIIQNGFSLSILPLVFIGIVAAGVGVAVRPGDFRVLLAAAGCALLAAWSLLPEWDTIRLLLYVLTVLAIVCAAIVPLPRTGRRIAFSLVILFHFGGIGCAVMNVSPSPWLTQFLWAHMYHYYLNFIYMTNAYHFYAPEPGPGIMIWFDVKYDDGMQKWVKLPVRDNHYWLLNYQRRLSLPEQINQTVNTGLPENPSIVQNRRFAGMNHGIPFYYEKLNPHPTEYRPPQLGTKIMLESYARHVARTTPNPANPNSKVVGVKVYRVVHRLMTPQETALGIQPDKKWMYLPSFQGEFDADGKLKNDQDPYLYWLIPIVNTKNPHLSSGEGVEQDNFGALYQDDDILDCLEIHANLPTILPANNPAPAQQNAAPAGPGAIPGAKD